MLIGQAPGREEAKRGRPFVGPAGERLDFALAEADIDRDRAFVSNVCSCYPPGDREPRVDEVEVCIQGLYSEIKKVKPSIIVLLGSTATHAFFKTNVTRIRGSVMLWEHDGSDYVIVPTIHPAATLRRWEDYPMMVRDFKLVRRLLEGDLPTPPKLDWVVVSDIQELERVVSEALRAAYIFVDIECEGFDPKVDRLLCIGIRFGGRSYVIPWTVSETLEPYWGRHQNQAFKLMKELMASGVAKVGHNIASFDQFFLEHKGMPMSNITFDTMIAHHLLNENEGHSLEHLRTMYTDIPYYEGQAKSHLSSSKDPFSKIPSLELYEYNANDLLTNEAIYDWEQKGFASYPRLQKLFYDLSMPLTSVLYDIERRGMMVDLSKGERLRAEYEESAAKLEQELFALVGHEFNPKAAMQVEKVLFEELRLPPVSKTPGGRYSTDEETLSQLAKQHPVPGKISELRKHYKLISTYFSTSDASPLHVDENSRVHPQYLIIGPKHGRVSTINPNFQGIPRDGPVRELFVAPPGFFFLEADESITEMRMMAHVSRDEAMLKAFKDRVDIHVQTASIIFDISSEELLRMLHSDDPEERKKADDMRYLAKFFDFGVNYGRGPLSIAQQYKMSEREAVAKFNKFMDTYRGVAKYQEDIKRLAHKQGWVEYPTGRRRRVPALLDPIIRRDTKLTSDMERSCIASVIQGASADIHHYGTIAVHKALKAYNYKSGLIGTLHDAWFFEIAEDEAEKVIPFAMEILLRVPLELMGLEIPIKAELGRYWGDQIV
jgi:DNA polymerase-1